MTDQEKQDKINREIGFASNCKPALDKILEEFNNQGVISKFQTKHSPMECFDIHLKDIKCIIAKFIKSLPNKEYSHAFLEQMKGKNKNVKICWGNNMQRGAVTGRIGNNPHNPTEVYIPIGEEKRNKMLISSFNRIGTAVHEISHSLSQKHNNKEFLKPEVDEAQEIEAMFMEKLFYRYLSENSVELSQKLAKMGYKFITPEFLEDMEITFNYDHTQGLNEKLKDFLNLDASSVILDDKFENTKFYKYRYVIGDIYSEVLFEKYKENPVKVMSIYKEFIKSNARIENIDKIADYLFPNIKDIKAKRKLAGKKDLTSHEIVTKHFSKMVPDLVYDAKNGITI